MIVASITNADRAHAIPPLPRCFVLPSTSAGYEPGALYLGLFGDTECNYEPESDTRRFGLVFVAAGLFQLDASARNSTVDVTIPRAQVSVGALVLQHVLVYATGDAANRSIPEATLQVGRYGLSLMAGRNVVPFSLENAWADSKLPFLEHGVVVSTLGPAQRQHGASLSLFGGRDIETAAERSDTTNTLGVHAEVGVFRPVDAESGYAVIGRVFARRDRNNDYKSLDTHLHLGASAAIGPGEQRYAVEADARYYRYRATAEAMLADVDGELLGYGGALTLSATIPANRERWWTEPLRRESTPTFGFVSTERRGELNPGVEVDLGVEAMRTAPVMMTTSTTTAVHAAIHAFASDYVKLSLGYRFVHSLESRHEATLRLQLAL